MWRCDGFRGCLLELWSRLNLSSATSMNSGDELCQGLHPKGLGRFVLPSYIPASLKAYSVPVPQADILKVSPAWLFVCLGSGIWESSGCDKLSWRISAAALSLCHPGITPLHHQPPPLLCFLQACICKIPKFSPLSLLNAVLLETIANYFIWIVKKNARLCFAVFACGQTVSQGLCNQTHVEHPDAGYWSLVGFRKKWLL